jgi:hypothetical protein
MSTDHASLAWLQDALHQHILNGDDRVVEAVRSQGGLPARDRLKVYRDAYRWRLLEVMQDHFAQTHLYLGDEFFHSEAMAFIEAHPSQHHSLRDYGQAWPEWLSDRYPDDTDMADLARLEWALRRAFDAPDGPALSLADLGLIPAEAWATLGFKLAPGATLLHLHHAIAPLWQSLQAQEAPEPVPAVPCTLLVWRQGWQPHFRSIQGAEAMALQALMAGQSFTQACASLAPQAEGEAIAGQWLQTWASQGLLASVQA